MDPATPNLTRWQRLEAERRYWVVMWFWTMHHAEGKSLQHCEDYLPVSVRTMRRWAQIYQRNERKADLAPKTPNGAWTRVWKMTEAYAKELSAHIASFCFEWLEAQVPQREIFVKAFSDELAKCPPQFVSAIAEASLKVLSQKALPPE